MKQLINHKNFWLVTIAALGYFVDIYDLIVFNVVKNASLIDLGSTGDSIKSNEILLFNLQMTGMLVGGLIWGILGDKKGRVAVLFGSIFLYSIANIANAFVVNVFQYGLARFIAGIGLAGELGAGITLVSENMDKDKRGYGTLIIVTFGALGAVLAGIIGQIFSWQATYIVGGVLGLALLFLRAGAFESGMYQSLKELGTVKRGNIKLLFKKENALKYLACIGIGLPIWFTIGVLVNLSNRFSVFYQTQGLLVADAVMYAYLGLSSGDLLSGLLSQFLKSRKKVVKLYLVFSLLLFVVYLYNSHVSLGYFKFMAYLLGFATGYWALFVTIAAEQFGTNIRSTVTNTVPNFVRGAVVPITLSFTALSQNFPITDAAMIVGAVCLAIAWISISYVKESFSKDLNYIELD